VWARCSRGSLRFEVQGVGLTVPAGTAGGLRRWLAQPAPTWVWRALFALLMVCSARLVVGVFYRGWNPLYNWNFIYQAATDSFNYIQFGFVRRGLSGTLIYLSGLPQIYGTLVFHFVSAALVAGVVCIILRRSRETMQSLIAPVGVMVILMLCWAEDAGRTDPMTAALIAFAAVALVAGRAVAAAALLVVGLAVHETSFIYGLPLLTGLLIALGSKGRPSGRQIVPAVLLLAVVTVTYAFFDHFPRASNAAMTEAIQERMPSHILVDYAIYFATSGMRGVVASMCQNTLDPNYGLHFWSGLLILVMTTALLFGRRWRAWALSALVGFVPFLFLFIVANDMARWTVLACFNILLLRLLVPALTTGAPARAAAPMSVRQLAVIFVSLGALLVVAHPKRPLKIRVPIYSPSPFIEGLSIRLGGQPTPDVGVALQQCDPDWRSVLTLP